MIIIVATPYLKRLTFRFVYLKRLDFEKKIYVKKTTTFENVCYFKRLTFEFDYLKRLDFGPPCNLQVWRVRRWPVGLVALYMGLF